MQNRVHLALPQLPSAVTQQGVSVQKKSSTIMMLLGVTGKGGRYSPGYVANYANVYVLDALKRVPGAGQAQIMGVPDQAMRIWMNPDRMASLAITTSDIANAINTQNALFGAGQIGQQPAGLEDRRDQALQRLEEIGKDRNDVVVLELGSMGSGEEAAEAGHACARLMQSPTTSTAP